MAYANAHDYPEINADKLKPLRDQILLKWDEQPTTVLNGKLLTPQTNRKQYYTGTILSIGDGVMSAIPRKIINSDEWVEPEIKVGNRIFFYQFSDFKKYFDPKYGRLALIEESRQGECFAVVPPRVNIGPGESDYDYDKD